MQTKIRTKIRTNLRPANPHDRNDEVAVYSFGYLESGSLTNPEVV